MKSVFKSEKYRVTKQRLKLSLLTFFKWVACSCFAGVVIGFIGTIFHILLEHVTEFRQTHWWMLFLLPIAGILITAIYHAAHAAKSRGTNLVITAIQSNEEVPGKMAPLIMISTLLTHACGGSAGREGAALQIGGSIGNELAKFFDFDEKDTRILIMCGMSACFGALFGTPIAAAVFSMEVISVGIMYYAALVPCTISALIGSGISSLFGISGTHFDIGIIPNFSLGNATKMILMSTLFALASIILCITLHKAHALYSKYLENQYIRAVVAGIFVIILRFLCGSSDYLGAGTDIIAKSFVTQSIWCAFLLKIIFTAVTLGGGFKGGEIVPTLFVGATLGSFLGPIFGLPTGLCAACGMVTVFCGVTNCPLTSLILSIEMFGGDSIKFCMLCIAIGYLLSGYYSLYNSQKIIYSKYKTEYVNKKTH